VTWCIWAGEVRKWERVVESSVQGLGEFVFDYWKCSEERRLSVSLESGDAAERGFWRGGRNGVGKWRMKNLMEEKTRKAK
jgi:hypothetical protein